VVQLRKSLIIARQAGEGDRRVKCVSGSGSSVDRRNQ